MIPIMVIYMISYYTFAVDPVKSAQIFLAILESKIKERFLKMCPDGEAERKIKSVFFMRDYGL